MSSKPVDLRGSIQITPHRKRIADAAFMAGPSAWTPADPDPTGKITDRIPTLARPTQQRLQRYLNHTVAGVRR